MSTLAPAAFAASLAGFRNMNVHRLGALLRHHTPEQAWHVVTGELPAGGLIGRVLTDPAVRASWRRSAAERPPDAVWQRCHDLGVQVLHLGGPGYPPILCNDPLPPPVLFVVGDLTLLTGRRAAVVGTRNATAVGREAARRIGHGLAAGGVHVVSGLARGIDGCAHRGVVEAQAPGRPIGIVASGLDVVYPREHGALWRHVASHGLLLSEAPPGTPPEAHRFPLRNRIVAALAEVIVVVESRERGGSLITVNEAAERGVPVMAVPGGVANRAANGCNNLLREGAMPVTEAADVLAALALDHGRAHDVLIDQRPRPRRRDIALYQVLAGEPRTIDGLALAAGVTLVDAAMSVARLEAAGWVAQADGWFETIGAPLR